jgi:hypothetical protein
MSQRTRSLTEFTSFGHGSADNRYCKEEGHTLGVARQGKVVFKKQ